MRFPLPQPPVIMNTPTSGVKETAGSSISIPSSAAEAIIIGLACLAPWAIGAVDAWAILALDLGIALIGLLTAAELWRTGRSFLLGVPSLALLGLILLAFFQASPLPLGTLKALAPLAGDRWESLVPVELERVIGDDRPPVGLPSPTLSLVPNETIQTASRLMASLVLFQCVLALGSGFGTLRRFGLATCINATFMALFALVQALSWNGKIYWVRPSPNLMKAWFGGGPFVCHNHLAQYLNMGFGFALAMLISGWKRRGEAGRGSGVWLVYSAALLFVGILVSNSRGGYLATAAATCGTFVMLRLRFGKFSFGLLLGMVGMAGFALAILLAVGDASPYMARMSTMLDSGDLSLAGRLLLWGNSWSSWQDHPLWGSGLGSFPTATAPYATRDFGVYFHRAENEYIDLLVEGGLVGLGLGLAALAAIVRGARRAWQSATRSRDQGAVLGACFGGMAVAVHSVFDFGLHIPGVGFSVVVLAAHLYRLGLQSPDRDREPTEPKGGRILAIVFGVAATLAMAWVVAVQYRAFRCEAALMGSEVPMPGSRIPSADEGFRKAPELERDRQALELALSHQPDWCDGHLWIGKIHTNLYQLAEERRSGGLARSSGDTSPQADPLWLLREAYADADRSILDRATREGDPVREHLIPALRSFLEARRCNPHSALAQAKIAGLTFLTNGGDPSADYAERAFGLSGWDEVIVDFVAEVSARIGRPDLAARCWRKSLTLRPQVWPFVADSAASVLSPAQILDDLLADGKHTVQFAERLYPSEEDREIREGFLRAALDRLSRDQDLEMAERTWFEALARAGLDQRDQARRLMQQSLMIEPTNSERRARFVALLLAWGDAAEAHSQALAGVGLAPDHYGLQQALKKSVNALARGKNPHG
jgi:O-antigen ligase/tetratricopeptide (TPR) repeat protein